MTDYLHIQLPPDQIRGISSIGLAHMGDAVYELLVRTWLCANTKDKQGACAVPFCRRRKPQHRYGSQHGGG